MKMNTAGFVSPEDIDKAVDALEKLRPAYAGILEFYRKVFKAQEEVVQSLKLEPIQIPDHVLEVKRKEGFPLIQMSEFVLDPDASDRLLKELCRAASNANEVLSAAANSLSEAMHKGVIESDRLYKTFLDTGDGYFEEVAKQIGIEIRALTFFVYNGVKPSLAVCAQNLLDRVGLSESWGKGICPVCGNPPGLAAMEGQGERYLFCSFCWTKWRVQRIFCAFCENQEHKTLNYFYSEAEPEYRVDTCNLCKKYLKTVDIREIGRIFYPPLEQVSTLHLDMRAGEMGYQNPMDIYL